MFRSDVSSKFLYFVGKVLNEKTGKVSTRVNGWQYFRWMEHIGLVVRMSILDTEVDGSNSSISMFFPSARDFIRIASVDSAVKRVPGGDNLVKGVQCYELFRGIALKNHAFSFSLFESVLTISCGSLLEDARAIPSV